MGIGILPMSPMGVPPVQMPKNMGKMPMRLMGETPMLRRMAFFNGLLGLSVVSEFVVAMCFLVIGAVSQSTGEHCAFHLGGTPRISERRKET